MTQPSAIQLLEEALAFCDVPREAKIVYLTALESLRAAASRSSERPGGPVTDMLEELRQMAQREHYEPDNPNEGCWMMRVKRGSEEKGGTWDGSGECDCGAKEHNVEVDALVARLLLASRSSGVKADTDAELLDFLDGIPNDERGIVTQGPDVRGAIAKERAARQSQGEGQP